MITNMQCAIDNAKRRYDIDINNEIKRIKQDMDIDINGYPKFWLNIRKGFSKDKINYNLQCPMNYIADIQLPKFRNNTPSIPTECFVETIPLKENRRKSKKVEFLIEKYSLKVYENIVYNNEHDFLLLRSDFDELINDIQKIYISKNYTGLFSWLISSVFYCKPKQKRNIKNIEKNKPILLKVLYTINPKIFISIFSKNVTF